MFRNVVDRVVLAHRGWRYRLKLEAEEIRWLRRVVRPGDFVVDAGAHKGGYTYWLRRSVGKEGRILAFEPQPGLARYLQRMAEISGWRNVRVENMGLSSEPGELPLFIPGEGWSPGATFVPPTGQSARAPITIPVDTLDGYLERTGPWPPVRVMKCDVEGHELAVFRGAERTLATSRPLLLFECEARHDPSRSVSAVFRFLEERGYHGHFFWRGAELAVSEFDASVHQRVGRHPYVANFVFVPA